MNLRNIIKANFQKGKQEDCKSQNHTMNIYIQLQNYLFDVKFDFPQAHLIVASE